MRIWVVSRDEDEDEGVKLFASAEAAYRYCCGCIFLSENDEEDKKWMLSELKEEYEKNKDEFSVMFECYVCAKEVYE